MALGEAAATKGIPCVLYGLKKKKRKKQLQRYQGKNKKTPFFGCCF
jgi:hypothetical protein